MTTSLLAIICLLCTVLTTGAHGRSASCAPDSTLIVDGCSLLQSTRLFSSVDALSRAALEADAMTQMRSQYPEAVGTYDDVLSRVGGDEDIIRDTTRGLQGRLTASHASIKTALLAQEKAYEVDLVAHRHVNGELQSKVRRLRSLLQRKIANSEEWIRKVETIRTESRDETAVLDRLQSKNRLTWRFMNESVVAAQVKLPAGVLTMSEVMQGPPRPSFDNFVDIARRAELASAGGGSGLVLMAASSGVSEEVHSGSVTDGVRASTVHPLISSLSQTLQSSLSRMDDVENALRAEYIVNASLLQNRYRELFEEQEHLNASRAVLEDFWAKLNATRSFLLVLNAKLDERLGGVSVFAEMVREMLANVSSHSALTLIETPAFSRHGARNASRTRNSSYSLGDVDELLRGSDEAREYLLTLIASLNTTVDAFREEQLARYGKLLEAAVRANVATISANAALAKAINGMLHEVEATKEEVLQLQRLRMFLDGVFRVIAVKLHGLDAFCTELAAVTDVEGSEELRVLQPLEKELTVDRFLEVARKPFSSSAGFGGESSPSSQADLLLADVGHHPKHPRKDEQPVPLVSGTFLDDLKAAFNNITVIDLEAAESLQRHMRKELAKLRADRAQIVEDKFAIMKQVALVELKSSHLEIALELLRLTRNRLSAGLLSVRNFGRDMQFVVGMIRSLLVDIGAREDDGLRRDEVLGALLVLQIRQVVETPDL